MILPSKCKQLKALRTNTIAIQLPFKLLQGTSHDHEAGKAELM